MEESCGGGSGVCGSGGACVTQGLDVQRDTWAGPNSDAGSSLKDNSA